VNRAAAALGVEHRHQRIVVEDPAAKRSADHPHDIRDQVRRAYKQKQRRPRTRLPLRASPIRSSSDSLTSQRRAPVRRFSRDSA
jgi:hypothetical protein